MEEKEGETETQILLYFPAFMNSLSTLSLLRWKITWLTVWAPSSLFLSISLLLFCLILPEAKPTWWVATEKQRYLSHFISLQEDIQKKSSNFMCLRRETHLSAQMCIFCHLAELRQFKSYDSAEKLNCYDIPRQFQFTIKLLQYRGLFHCSTDANCCALLSLGGEASTQFFLFLPICLACFSTLSHLPLSAPRGLHRNSSPISTQRQLRSSLFWTQCYKGKKNSMAALWNQLRFLNLPINSTETLISAQW